MIYVVIPVFNRIAFTLECLGSLSAQQYKDHHVIVVNDGSSDNTTALIHERFPATTVLEGSGELWWSASTNIGVAYAQSISRSDDDYILTLNNDLVVNENYLDEMIWAAKKFPDTMIGSLAVDIRSPEKIHYTGTLWNSRTAVYRPATDRQIPLGDLLSRETLLPTSLLPGRGTLIPMKIFRQIGLYDHLTFPQYMGDEDFALRAKKAGFHLGVCARAIVYSHVQETGLGNSRKKLRYYVDYFTSLRSHANLSKRWSWARRHANVSPYLYFALDASRLTMNLIFRW